MFVNVPLTAIFDRALLWHTKRNRTIINKFQEICWDRWAILITPWVEMDDTIYWYRDDGVSNHQPRGCLLNRLFRRRSKKTSKLRVTGLCVENSPGPMNSPHKGPVTRKMFPFGDVIMSFDYWLWSSACSYICRHNDDKVWVYIRGWHLKGKLIPWGGLVWNECKHIYAMSLYT